MTSELRVGDRVRVRSTEEILRTLDTNACLEGLPFMPQMFNYCGKEFTVFKSAHKTCDTINRSGGRQLPDTVHLELRCDGQAFGGCQAKCLIFWKQNWLEPLGRGSTEAVESTSHDEPMEYPLSGCTRENVKLKVVQELGESGSAAYRCQATALLSASTPLSPWNLPQYIQDLRSGNTNVWRMACGFTYMFVQRFINAGIGLGAPIRWTYDVLQRLWGGVPYPRGTGAIPEGASTPTANLNLMPGEMVRVKSYREILATLNAASSNRGLWFDAEMVPYCGKVFRVLERVETILDEKTGRPVRIKSPSVLLEGTACQARYSECRLFCPRAILPLWREIWLERDGNSRPQDSLK